MGAAVTWQTGLFLVCVLGAGWWARTDVRRMAFVVGVVLPIDHLTGVPHVVIDAVRYAGTLGVIALTPAGISAPARRIAHRLIGLVVVLALVRIAFSLGHRDWPAISYTAVMIVGGAIALLVAYRPVLHRPVVAGWLVGITLSAVVALMQALSLPTLRQPEFDNDRFPGLTNLTMGFTWQMAYAFILWMYVVAVTTDRPRARVLAGLAAVACMVALLVNGAQGGLVGLVAGFLAAVWVFRRHLTWQRIRVPLTIVVGAVAVAAVAFTLGWLELATVDGLTGAGDYENEKARWTVFKAAWREMAEHPLVGLGRTTFIDRYSISPHNLALDSGVIGGITGLAAGVALFGYTFTQWFRGPRDRRPETITAYVLLAALLSSFFTETQGPFIGLARITIMTIAVLTVTGHLPRGPEATIEPALPRFGAYRASRAS